MVKELIAAAVMNINQTATAAGPRLRRREGAAKYREPAAIAMSTPAESQNADETKIAIVHGWDYRYKTGISYGGVSLD